MQFFNSKLYYIHEAFRCNSLIGDKTYQRNLLLFPAILYLLIYISGVSYLYFMKNANTQIEFSSDILFLWIERSKMNWLVGWNLIDWKHWSAQTKHQFDLYTSFSSWTWCDIMMASALLIVLNNYSDIPGQFRNFWCSPLMNPFSVLCNLYSYNLLGSVWQIKLLSDIEEDGGEGFIDGTNLGWHVWCKGHLGPIHWHRPIKIQSTPCHEGNLQEKSDDDTLYVLHFNKQIYLLIAFNTSFTTYVQVYA